MNPNLINFKFSYDSTYNRRPGEGYGMGTENLNISGFSSLNEVIKTLKNNSTAENK